MIVDVDVRCQFRGTIEISVPFSSTLVLE